MNKTLIYLALRNSVATKIDPDGGEVQFRVQNGGNTIDDYENRSYRIKPFGSLKQKPSLKRGDLWQEVDELITKNRELMRKQKESVEEAIKHEVAVYESNLKHAEQMFDLMASLDPPFPDGFPTKSALEEKIKTNKLMVDKMPAYRVQKKMKEIHHIFWAEMKNKLVGIMPKCYRRSSNIPSIGDVDDCAPILNQEDCKKQDCLWSPVVDVEILTEDTGRDLDENAEKGKKTLLANNVYYRQTKVDTENGRWVKFDEFKSPASVEIMDKRALTPAKDDIHLKGVPTLHIDTFLRPAPPSLRNTIHFLRSMYGKQCTNPTEEPKKTKFVGHMYNVWTSLQEERITSAPLGILSGDKGDKHVIYGFALEPGQAVVFRTSRVMHGMLNFIQGQSDDDLKKNNKRTSIDIRFFAIHEINPKDKDFDAHQERVIPDVDTHPEDDYSLYEAPPQGHAISPHFK